MSAPTREGLYVWMAYIDKLARYADGGEDSDEMLPGLTPVETQFLRSPQGQATVSLWLAAFSDTIRLLKLFRDQDLHGRRRKPQADMEAAYEAAESALEALRSRVRLLAAHGRTAIAIPA